MLVDIHLILEQFLLRIGPELGIELVTSGEEKVAKKEMLIAETPQRID